MDARDHDRSEDVGLIRLTSWATAAALALTVAAVASLSPAGSQRAGSAIAGLMRGENRQAIAQREAESEKERRSVNEALRLLASDRDRLMTRLGSLERNLDDITGSVLTPPTTPPSSRAKSLDKAQEPVTPPPPEVAAEPPAKPEASDWLTKPPDAWSSAASAVEVATGPAAWPAVAVPAPAPAQRVAALPAEPATQSTLGRTEFGVDIGSGSDLEDVKLLLSAARVQHGRLLGNLRPVVQRRDDGAGNPEYRLVLGPLANAGAAARLCATLSAADVVCSTKAYQGERLIP